MKRILCLLLVLMMLPTWLFSCTTTPVDPANPDNPDDPNNNSANVGELLASDRFIIARDGASSYNVVRPEKGLAPAALGAGAIIDAIKAKCGVELGVLMDDEAAGEYEILVGDTNRPESSAAMAALTDTNYSITISGNKIVIAAKTELMLECAISYFIENYIETVPAAEGTFSFKKDMSHTSSTEFYLFDKADGTNFLVTYPNSEKEYQVYASYGDEILYNLEYYANSIYTVLKNSKTAGAVISSDKLIGVTESKAEWKEILVGGTTRTASKDVKATLAYDEYAIKVVDNDIVITGLGYVTTTAAVDKFIEIINTFKDESSGNPLYRIPADFSYKATVSGYSRWPSIPEYTGGVLDSVTDAGNESFVAVYTDTTKEEYQAYLTHLEGQGYTKYAENDLNGNLTAIYKTDLLIVNAIYMPYASRVHIVAEKAAKVTLPALESENVYTDLGVQSSITQMKLNNVTNSNGQCHVFRLCDGRFIIVDGGGNDEDKRGKKDDADNLMDLLKSFTGGAKPVVAAWFITHLHGDHFNVLVEISKEYKNDITVENFIYNFPPASMMLGLEKNTTSNVTKAMSVFKGAKQIIAHTGHKYYFANAEIEMIFAPELICPNYITYFNDSSTVFTVNIGGTKTLITADASPNTSNMMCNMYGDYLQCDVLQISHHGSHGCSMDFYKFTNPTKLAFLPVGVTQKARLTNQPQNVFVAKLVKIIPHYQGTYTYDLPAKN